MTMSPFAETVFRKRYSMNGRETWEDTAQRVAACVLGAVDAPRPLVKDVEQVIAERKFMPGGRYLYASGRGFHQTQNCFSGDTRVVTRYGTKTLECLALAGNGAIVLTTEGKWVRAGVECFGVQPLLRVTLRRAGVEKEIYATANHSWRTARRGFHGRPTKKESVETKDLKSQDRLWDAFGYGILRTPISPAGVQHGLVYGDGNVPQRGDWDFNTANIRLCGDKNTQLLKHFSDYPSRSIDSDIEVSGLPRHYKRAVSLESDRSYLLGWLAGYFAADGCVSAEGQVTISSTDLDSMNLVKDVCYLLGVGAYGIRYVDRISNLTQRPSRLYSVALMPHTLSEEFFLIEEHKKRFKSNPPNREHCHWSVVSVESTDRVEPVFCAVVPETHEFVLEDNILTGNCMLLRAEDSREGWGDVLHKSVMSLMTGAGIGINYSELREEGVHLKRSGGEASGPIALMQMINEMGRGARQGGSRRGAIWAGLRWDHPDILKFIVSKDWPAHVRTLKEQNFNFPAHLDYTNISVCLNDEFFQAYINDSHGKHFQAQSIYWAVVRNMCRTGEPGFSVDVGEREGEDLRNACTEIVSRDDSDVCNLGSINLARIDSLEEMRRVTELGTIFLLAGTLYSDLPYPKVGYVREKNRRLGLGLVGLHEWLLKSGKRYEPDDMLGRYLEVYDKYSSSTAWAYANDWGISTPIATKAIAPTGTIGIVAETTTGAEPIFCAAYKRRYRVGASDWHYQYVIDPTAKNLVERGVNPDLIEDAYAIDVKRRIDFQSWLQSYVDQGISSTINLPPWGSTGNNEDTTRELGEYLIQRLPYLRGITVYPDGSRGGQPLSRVSYAEASSQEGEVFSESIDVCDLYKGGSCGS